MQEKIWQELLIKSKKITVEDYLNLFALSSNRSKTKEITLSEGHMSIKKIKK